MKIIRVIAYVILFVILSVSLAGCSSSGEDASIINEKIASELTYLDTKLIEMINSTNGISLENYIVKAEKIEEEGANKDTSNKGSSASEQNAESFGTSSETGEESSSSSASEPGGKSSGQQSGQSGGGQSSNNVKYQMQGNEILLQDRTPKWQEVKADIEKMYADWSTIILDLYEANVDSQEILNFNQDLDMATR